MGKGGSTKRFFIFLFFHLKNYHNLESSLSKTTVFKNVRVQLNMIIGLSHSVLADFSVNNEGFIKPFHKPSLGLICSASRFHFYWILVEWSGAARGKKIEKI